jgi:hypothetical protein
VRSLLRLAMLIFPDWTTALPPTIFNSKTFHAGAIQGLNACHIGSKIGLDHSR